MKELILYNIEAEQKVQQYPLDKTSLIQIRNYYDTSINTNISKYQPNRRERRKRK